MLLRDIIGQEKLKHQLVEMVQHQRLSHALLFVGPEGSGALPLAIAFAQYLVSSPTTTNQVLDMFADPDALAKQIHTYNEPDAIADLPAYQRANQLMHPDLHFSFPTITEKPGQKNISANFIE
jgi:DNA polymerase-3 subunit delta'